jgi:hypothetical protein
VRGDDDVRRSVSKIDPVTFDGSGLRVQRAIGGARPKVGERGQLPEPTGSRPLGTAAGVSIREPQMVHDNGLRNPGGPGAARGSVLG